MKKINEAEFFELYRKFKPHISRLSGRDARRVLTMLLEATEEVEVCVTDIRESLKMSQAAVSGVLRHFRAIGLVNVERRGRFRFYSLNTDQMQGLLFFMAKCVEK